MNKFFNDYVCSSTTEVMHQYEKVLNVQLSLGEMRGCKDKSFKKPNLKTCYKIEAKGGKSLYKEVIFEILRRVIF